MSLRKALNMYVQENNKYKKLQLIKFYFKILLLT